MEAEVRRLFPAIQQKSLLVKAIHYDDPDLQMPPRGKLADSDIAAIEAWIKNASAATLTSSSAKPVVETPAKVASSRASAVIRACSGCRC